MAITVNQIAEQCGVSRTTVLRALNGGSVSKDTKERILQVAKDNNYRPNLLARSLNHGRTMSLGVVTINIENMYFVQSLNTINKVINILENNCISYIVKENMEDVNKKMYGNKNKYKCYLDKGKKKIDLDYRINKIINKINCMNEEDVNKLLDLIEENI